MCLCLETYLIVMVRSHNNAPWEPKADRQRPRGPGPSTDSQELRIPESTHPDGNCMRVPEEYDEIR